MLFNAVPGDFRFTAKAALCHTVACRDLLPGSQCSQKRLLRHGLCLLPPRSIQRAEEGGKERISCPHCITCLYHLGSLFHDFSCTDNILPGCAIVARTCTTPRRCSGAHNSAKAALSIACRKASPDLYRGKPRHSSIGAVLFLFAEVIGKHSGQCLHSRHLFGHFGVAAADDQSAVFSSSSSCAVICSGPVQLSPVITSRKLRSPLTTS